MTTGRLYIEEIQLILPYPDRRSIRNWCKKNQVRILSDIGTKKRFVLIEEFENVIEQNNRGALPDKLSAKSFIKEKKKKITALTRKYKPQGENEKKILSIFTSLL